MQLPPQISIPLPTLSFVDSSNQSISFPGVSDFNNGFTLRVNGTPIVSIQLTNGSLQINTV